MQQMVDLSRMDEDVKGIMEQFSLSDALLDTADLFRTVAENAGKSLVVEIQEGVQCIGDEGRIRQMAGLLLDNAVKYASFPDDTGKVSQDEKREECPAIRFSMIKKGKKAEILLQNPTAGIEKGNQDILFERFYRPDSSRNSCTGGSGIGLSVVKAIVEGHRGSITAISEDGKSIEFRIVIPVRKI